MGKLQVTPYKYVIPIILVYCIASVTGMLHHELFLEEAQQLTISRDSTSIADVFRNMLYEGHVTLWNTFLFFITHYISAKPVYMQLFHLIVISYAVFLFLRYAPFNITVKVLLVFGCYLFFVYSIVSRNYALGILLLFLCCILLANPEKNVIKIGIVLVLMCFTHLFYAFAAIGIFMYMLPVIAGKKQHYRQFAIFTALLLFGTISALLQSKRIPADSIVNVKHGLSWVNVNDLTFGLTGISRGFITIPALNGTYFWDKQFIQTMPSAVNILLAFALFIITLLFVYKSRKALLFYIPAVALQFAFLSMAGMAGTRYFGVFFLFFIVAMWLAYYDGVLMFPSMSKAVGQFASRLFIYCILVIQFFTGIYFYIADFTKPFSQAKNTVNYITAHHLDNASLVVDGYNAAPPLSAYLGRKIFYLDIDQYGSFCIWKKVYLPFPRKALMDEITGSVYVNRFKEFILITNRNNEAVNNATYTFTKLAAFEGAIIQGEDYYVYRVKKN